MDCRIGSRLAFQNAQPMVRSSSAPPPTVRMTSSDVPRVPVRMSNNHSIVQYRETAEYQKKCIQRIESIVNTQDKMVEKLRQLECVNDLDLESVFNSTHSEVTDWSKAMNEMIEMIEHVPTAVTEEMETYGLSCIAMCEDAYTEATDAWIAFDETQDSQQLRTHCAELAKLVENKRSRLLSVRDDLASMQRVDMSAQTESNITPDTAEIGINTLPRVTSTGTSMLRVKTKEKEVQTKAIKKTIEKTIEKAIAINVNTQTPEAWAPPENQTSKKINHKNIDDLYVAHITQACASAAAALAVMKQEFPIKVGAAGEIERARAMHGLLAESWLHSLDQLDAYRSKMWAGMFPIRSGRLHELTLVRLLELESFRFGNIQQVGKSYEKQDDVEFENQLAVKRIRTIVADVLPPIELVPSEEVKEKMMRTLASHTNKISSYLTGEDRALRIDGKALTQEDIEHLLFNDFLPLAAQVNLCARELVMIEAFDELEFHNQFLLKAEEMAPEQSFVDASRKIGLSGNQMKRHQCEALEAACKSVSPLSIFNEREALASWSLEDIKTMAYCLARFQFGVENEKENLDKGKRAKVVHAFENLKNTFEKLTERVKVDFRLKLKELQSNGQKMTLDGHTEFLKQLKKKCEDIDELLRKTRGEKESNCRMS